MALQELYLILHGNARKCNFSLQVPFYPRGERTFDWILRESNLVKLSIHYDIVSRAGEVVLSSVELDVFF